MRSDYKQWLEDEEYAANTVVAQLHRVAKVEQYYGDLEEALNNAQYDSIIADLTYSASDEKAAKPNPSRMIFEGNIRNNLQSYKNAVVRYRKFLTNQVLDKEASAAARLPLEVFEAPIEKQKLSLERDMQSALRRDVDLLEAGLHIIDDGAERAVSSGFIDILCQDQTGKTVVVELKAGKTDARVVGQILGYMGDLMFEDEPTAVRGIIVAHEFDKRTISAARAVPNLKLMKYSISFKFEAEEGI
ncbi:DUF91 domain-containing protein [Rhizobium sp. CG5]|uniref:endonuclease NucS domain-containing protein n=1 Tax=Rhizobium sp. CG5 TaxID=2726076 RepID=UPI0020341829|nr:endonuclease NucS domain-containing protein [Rhizobium sp. CG5]MCM2472944.1 DUF91 domain-containing protein [Rhizobium sp. CG5]